MSDEVEAAIEEEAANGGDVGALFLLLALAKHNGAQESAWDVVRYAMHKFKDEPVNAQTAERLVVEIIELSSARFGGEKLDLSYE